MRLLTSILVLLLVSDLALSQHLCRTDVSYIWKPADSEKEETVLFATGERGGQTLEEAKRYLDLWSKQESIKALSQCYKEREDIASCIAEGLTRVARIADASSFTARKAMEDAVKKGCQTKSGRCLSTKIGESVCQEVVDKKAEPEQKEDKPEKGKKR